MRHINHMTIEAFYHLYEFWAEGAGISAEQKASSRTFRDIYDQRWAAVLQMRELTQHARCTQCAEFSARIRRATMMNERAALEKAQQAHIINVKQFQQIQTRLQALSEVATSGEGADLQASVLKLDLDGLDQAKTRYPRNMSSSKSLSGLWRPQIHLVGCIIWGVPWLTLQSAFYNCLLQLLLQDLELFTTLCSPGS